jgi:hypothetical protein
LFFKIKTKKNYIIYFIIIVFGIFLSRVVGYGDDIDTHRLIHTYLNVIENGIYLPSRYYGSPLAEFIIGFFSYFFGGIISAFISYILFILSLNFLFTYYFKNQEKSFVNKKIIFFILCISNSILLFDNINPSDYILSLFFFSFGLFLLKTNYKFYSSILFAFSIACRANFAIFVIVMLILEFVLVTKKDIKKNIFNIFVNTIIISSLFYLPVTILNKFNLNFIYNDGGPEISVEQLLPRFIYKSYMLFGIYNSLIFLGLFIFILIKPKIKSIKNFIIQEKKYLALIIVNLVVFFFMPTKTALISFVVIFVYLFLIKNLNNKLLAIIIIFNIMYWIISYQILEIKYKYEDPCRAKYAIDANYKFNISEGFYSSKKKEIRRRIKCDSVTFKEKSEKYNKNQRLF